MSAVSLSNIVKRFGDYTAVHQMSLEIAEGNFVTLLGPSGCGKTTTLRMIAGLLDPTEGEIAIKGKRVNDVPIHKRNLGLVFQNYALFPHKTVAENVAFGLNYRNVPKDEARRKVAAALELVQLPDLGARYPKELSGGQQQRIALARALAPRPKLLLMDEPFSSMDVELREGLAREVRAILKQEGISGLLVTHDQFEAFAMADEIGVINAGELQQWANGYQLYHQPANRFVADFIGQGVLLPGTVLNPHQVETELGIIEGEVPAFCGKGCQVDILVRPDDIVHDDNADLPAEVLDKAFRGAQFLYTLRLQSGVKVLSLAHSHYDYEVGARMKIRLDIDHLVMFPRREDVRP